MLDCERRDGIGIVFLLGKVAAPSISDPNRCFPVSNSSEDLRLNDLAFAEKCASEPQFLLPISPAQPRTVTPVNNVWICVAELCVPVYRYIPFLPRPAGNGRLHNNEGQNGKNSWPRTRGYASRIERADGYRHRLAPNAG